MTGTMIVLYKNIIKFLECLRRLDKEEHTITWLNELYFHEFMHFSNKIRYPFQGML